MNYILTLDFIKEHCEEVIKEWNSPESETAETKAQNAHDILDAVRKIEELWPNVT